MSLFYLISPLFAQAAAAAQPAAEKVAETPWYQETWFYLLVALIVIAVPFIVGNWLAKRLRMNDYAWRLGLLLFSLTAGIVVCVYGWPPRLGIDLSGGVILVYEVDASKAASNDLATVVDALRKELNAGSDSTISVEASGDGAVQITLPGADAAETVRIEQKVDSFKGGRLRQDLPNTELVLESRPLHDGKQSLVYGLRRTGSADMDLMVSRISKRVNPGGQKEVTVRRMGADRVEVIIPKAEPAEIDLVKDKISTAGALQFRILANPKAKKHEEIIKLAEQTTTRDVTLKNSEGKDELVAQWVPIQPGREEDVIRPETVTRKDEKKGLTDVLTIISPYDVNGGELSRAYITQGEFGGSIPGFSFNSQGAALFSELTGEHVPDTRSGLKYQLGILLDDKVQSAPGINSRIGDHGVIEGRFTPEGVQFIVDILNAGSLPAALNKVPVAEYSASAQLGKDTIRAGALSMIIATVVILIFMQIYYEFAGFVANLAVLLNLVLVMALMILIKAHLTLAGLAGLVLSVGMAVDANVLIYERMREERERGAALRMAIRNGFGRAMATIIDSHCTTLITGIVLFVIGTDQLRGFATTLVLGLLLNLYTAVYLSRIIFDVAERQRWLTKLKMLKLFGKTNFDFVKWMPTWMTLSVLAIVIGLGAAFAREMGYGASLFGIDFTGGTSVQIVTKKQMDIAQVREAVKSLPDVSVSAVSSPREEEQNTRFNIETSFHGENAAGEQSNTATIKAVKDKLNELFAGQLKTYSTEIVSIGAPAATEPPSKDAATKTESSETTGDNESPEKASAEKADNKIAKSDEKTGGKDSQTVAPTSSDSNITEAHLRFPDKIDFASLDAILRQGLADAGLPEAVFDLSSPDPQYTPGSSLAVQDWIVRVSLPKGQTEKLLNQVAANVANTPVFPTANSIGGKVASDTKTTAYYALAVSTLLVALYIWLRFQNLIFGLAAIVALIHDVGIAVGALALSYWLAGPLGFLQVNPFRISLEVVAALLTIVGYSINDTIVVFDRIREIRGKSTELTATMINQAVNQTLSRTILTSTTVFLVTFILYFFGGEGVHAFAFAMMIGVITGTYSSVFIAAPILLWFRRPTAAAAARPMASVSAAGRVGNPAV
jgi:SecD/SecF fusion protein